MATTLTYERLNEAADEFRLLTIIPSHDEDGPIACNLEVHSLAKPPPFHALSYVWGDPTDTIDIIVNGTIFKATKNLENALRALRLRLADPKDVITSSLGSPLDSSETSGPAEGWDGAYRIWADAVCINQSDAIERNAQVLRMRDIYTVSIATVAWLGQPAERSDAAFGLVGILAAREKHEQYNTVLDTQQRGYEYLWEALAQLLERDYWTRCWVLQELVLARYAWLLCGSDFTDLETFSFALYGAKFRHEYVLEQLGYPGQNKALQKTVMMKIYMKMRMKRHSAKLKREKVAEDALKAGEGLADEKEISEQERKRREHLEKYQASVYLSYLINEKTRARLQSTVLHDQIYSLLGLCDDPTTLIPEPSYDTPFRFVMNDMYQRLAKAGETLDWIRFSGGNEPLDLESCLIDKIDTFAPNERGTAGTSSEEERRNAHYKTISKERSSGFWPSWLPDNLKSFGSTVHGNTVIEGCMYQATKDQSAEFSFKDNVLSCRGIIFDAIQTPAYSAQPMHAAQFGVQTLNSDTLQPNPYGDVESTYEAIWRAATENAGVENLTDNHPCDSAWVFSEYWHSKWTALHAQSMSEILPAEVAAVYPEGGMPSGQAISDWPHESLYLPFSTFGPEGLDANKCVRRWGLLHDQKDMLVHGLPLREWVRRRTMLESLASMIPPNEKGVDEHLRHKSKEGDEEPILKSLISVKNIGAGFMIVNMWPSYWRGLKNIKTVPSSNELFVTEKGYIGGRFKFCSKKPGDKIALIFGCNTPVILRPRPEGEGYTFISGAYVHGIMDGEPCKDLDPGKVQWISIH